MISIFVAARENINRIRKAYYYRYEPFVQNVPRPDVIYFKTSNIYNVVQHTSKTHSFCLHEYVFIVDFFCISTRRRLRRTYPRVMNATRAWFNK